ncbi:hypothetical protein CTI12_AA025390 [Artemisia annua]|uniref:Uncharacterized protein n=1 Tax=Artemisia annua TaxID=35608 RepID=A0A2U1QIR8_ARTAN|nr:hypothetical protein CTI12_AA025390 [Artemisia annua]
MISLPKLSSTNDLKTNTKRATVGKIQQQNNFRPDENGSSYFNHLDGNGGPHSVDSSGWKLQSKLQTPNSKETFKAIAGFGSDIYQSSIACCLLVSRKIMESNLCVSNFGVCGDSPLKVLFPRVYALDRNKQCAVAQCLNCSDWSIDFRRMPRGGAEESQFTALLEAIREVRLSDASEDLFDSPSAAPRHLISSHSASSDPSSSDLTYRNRFLLSDDSDALGVPGLLVLPQSFGAIYLGENFCSYISINNSSNYDVRDIIIKSEIQTERQRILLLDASKAPVECIRAGGRYDFIVQHDVKELGAHAIVCNGEIFKPPILIRSGGGIYNFLYALKMSSQPTKAEGNNFLGKLQVTWRTNLGEPGSLQTQQIIGNPLMKKEIDLKAVQVPPVIILEKPFSVHLILTNLTEKTLGPFEVWLSLSDPKEEKAVMISGLQSMDLPAVEAFASLEFQLNMISAKLGVQKISGILVFDTMEKKTYDMLLDLEIFVDSDI